MSEDISPLLYWCKERESIRLKREKGFRPPWTNDDILLTYRFCNVRRRDDRVSKWLIDNVYTRENISFDLASFLMFSAWCRWVNWPPTIKFVLDEKLYPKKNIDWKALGSALDHISKTEKAWTGAYMIRAPEEKGASKGQHVSVTVVKGYLGGIVAQLISELLHNNPTYRSVHGILMRAHSYGSFMAGQIAGDWAYTSLLSKANDINTWAPMGPGSIRGFNRLMGNDDLKKPPPEELWEQKLVEWRAAILRELGSPWYESITALDVQNCLCETDKYLRVKNGEGKPRTKYNTHEGLYS